MATGLTPLQLPLNISLREDATFNNFYFPSTSKNAEVVNALQTQLASGNGAVVYLWGGSGSGITHLLQAACHTVGAQSQTSVYLPLGELAGYAPTSLLEGLEQQVLVCLDDLQTIAGNPGWEETLFDLYNRVSEQRHNLFIGADCGPHQLLLTLPDLRSRLGAAFVYHVESLQDDDKLVALQARASARGLHINNDVAQYILNRSPRDTHKLFDVLEHLDEMSLSAQRKLTIPFVKQVLGW